ncbi:MAG TPA: hypothetical protein PLK34_00840 [Candidatus Pacearchaeota archaeon]|nr:hypothetical protein [Candidatus Pacearchaeota archaeon]
MIEEICAGKRYIICGFDESHKGDSIYPDKPEIIVGVFSENILDGIPELGKHKRDFEGAREWMEQEKDWWFSLLRGEKYKNIPCNLSYEAPKLISQFLEKKGWNNNYEKMKEDKVHLGIHLDGEACEDYESKIISHFSLLPFEEIKAKNYIKSRDENGRFIQPRIVKIADAIGNKLYHFSLEELFNHPRLVYVAD